MTPVHKPAYAQCMVNKKNLDSVTFYSSENGETQTYGRKQTNELNED